MGIMLPPSMDEWLVEEGKARNLSRSELIAEAVDGFRVRSTEGLPAHIYHRLAAVTVPDDRTVTLPPVPQSVAAGVEALSKEHHGGDVAYSAALLLLEALVIRKAVFEHQTGTGWRECAD
ncbi:MAG: hypothetical protein FJZ01_09175 [Candidatus Sericytochromatia bacterium]|nr:hypothetical protein [Candidatus Tanganyikabacteria bacterium]